MISFEPLPRMIFSGATPQLRRERFAQIVAAAVRIKMRGLKCALHCRQRFGRRPERVLVRRQLDDIAGVAPSSRAVSSIGFPGS